VRNCHHPGELGMPGVLPETTRGCRTSRVRPRTLCPSRLRNGENHSCRRVGRHRKTTPRLLARAPRAGASVLHDIGEIARDVRRAGEPHESARSPGRSRSRMSDISLSVSTRDVNHSLPSCRTFASNGWPLRGRCRAWRFDVLGHAHIATKRNVGILADARAQASTCRQKSIL